MIFFGVLLTSGFPNFMMQEAHAASAYSSSITGAVGGDSTNTTNIVVTFSSAIYTTNGAQDGSNQNEAASFSVSGNTVTTANIPSRANGAACGGTTTVTLVLGTALATDATPAVTFTTNTAINACNDDTDVPTASSQTPTDGLSPQFSSASVTSATTIAVVFTETIDDAGTVAIGDFTLDNSGITSGASLTGTPSVSGTTVTLTVDNDIVSGDTLTIAYTETDGDLEDAANNYVRTFSAQTVTNGLSAESPSGGSGCNGDCEEPTLGVLPNGQRIVDDGFTYNGHSVDVERFFTPYPLITAQVGKQNTAVFKIYENRGPDNIAHFDFAFGLGKDQIISDSKAMIEVDFARDRTQTVNIIDPENALDNVSVTTDIVVCNGGSIQCLEITIKHTFREPLDFNIVGTNVWDYSRQSWQNYYNHGIEVVGTSMNPAKQHDGVNQGHIYHLTETSKTTAVDEFGDSWTFQYGIWMKDYIKQDRVQDKDTLVFDRMHSDFAEYREHLSNNAFLQLSETCPLCIEQYADFEDSTSLEYGNKINKLSDPEIQMLMVVEEQKAQEIMKRLLDVKYDLRNAYLGIEKDDRPIAEILEEERINKIILQAERSWLKQIIAPNQ